MDAANRVAVTNPGTMTRELTSFPISEDQLENFCDLLRECNLPYSDIKLAGNSFVGYTNEQGELMATGGLEFYGEYALLRSIAVRKRDAGKRWDSGLSMIWSPKREITKSNHFFC